MASITKLGIMFAILAFVARYGLLLHRLNTFSPLPPNHNHFKSCRNIAADTNAFSLDHYTAAEDIQIDEKTGLAFISSTDHQGLQFAGVLRFPPRVWVYDVKNEVPVESKLIGEPFQARVHGLSLIRDDKDNLLVFVIEHTPNKTDAVKVLQYNEQEKTLTLLKTFRHESLLTSANDLVAISKNEFYASNDHASPRGSILQTLEDFSSFSQAYLMYCNIDTGACKKVAYGQSANGVNISKDKRHVYFAPTLESAVNVYERDVKTNDLKLVETIPIGTGGDNIDVDINGDLWVGCHYKIFQFLGAISDITGQSIAPSHIIKIAPSQTNKSVVKSFYLNDGQEISASSAFATWQGKVGLIGTVFDKKILLCKI